MLDFGLEPTSNGIDFNMNYDYIFKFVITGNSGVGKSSLITRFADDTYAENYISTRIRTFKIDGKIIKLQIWDTAGQERFRTIICSYYRGAHGIVLVYDITDKKSFNDVKMWLNEIERHASENVCKVIVGNKSDLAAERAVDWTEGYEFANNCSGGAAKFIEASAKTAKNVHDIFINLATDLISRSNSLVYSEELYRPLNINSYKSVEEKKKLGCC